MIAGDAPHIIFFNQATFHLSFLFFYVFFHLIFSTFISFHYCFFFSNLIIQPFIVLN